MNAQRMIGMIACYLLFVGITERAAAQVCGGPASVQILCCGQKFQVFNYWANEPLFRAALYDAACPNGLICGSYPSAAGSCLLGALSTPKMIEELNTMSRRAPLMVASCTGGLVRYQPSLTNAPDINLIGRK